MTSLQYIVLFSSNVERLAMFYRALGLALVPEKHGHSPKHYSMTAGTLVIELYPKTVRKKFTFAGAENIMIGLVVESIDETLHNLQGGYTVSRTIVSGHRMASLDDPDGRQVRLTEKLMASNPAPP